MAANDKKNEENWTTVENYVYSVYMCHGESIAAPLFLWLDVARKRCIKSGFQ